MKPVETVTTSSRLSPPSQTVTSTAPVTSVPLPGSRGYRVSLFDAMKFKGPAPEAINGRLAMAGIVWGAVSEAKTGLPIADLFRNSTPQILVFAALITYASLIPILKGARSEAFGIFSPRAETTNGRAAMLGFGILLLLEANSQVPFF
ncbi:hypothetical protein WJX84_007933 [Apatococcus fuscideae]|uniref:Uncharacterized protein n=1 Tax=Apatococcus fuscideae TaxID=2026836 RepID=A0AAW1TLK3_9CHLO